MGLTLHHSEDRGQANHGWLESHHSFSFADFYDPDQMGFRSLRVINEDVIQAQSGFPMHGHRDMEIITYVTQGAVSHRDNSGGSGITSKGDVQVMTAGFGIRHSEFNASKNEVLRLLQIWIVPDEEGLTPSYDQRNIPEAEKINQLGLIVAPHGHDGVLTIHQDAFIYASILEASASVMHPLSAGRGAWIQVISGAIEANGLALRAGDAVSAEDVEAITLSASEKAEFLLFDLKA